MNSRSRSLYAVARPSVVCLSVGNTRAPYSGGCNFPQYFYGAWYAGHLLTSKKNLQRSSQGNSSIGEVKHDKIAIFDLLKAISWKRCRIGGKSVLITNRKSYMSFRLVPKSVTLNNLERRYFTDFGRFLVHGVEVVEDVVVKSSGSPSHLLMSFLYCMV